MGTIDHPRTGMANPASVFCVQKGGQLHPMHNAGGEYALCQLPDGRIVEEWAYFREQHNVAVPGDLPKPPDDPISR